MTRALCFALLWSALSNAHLVAASKGSLDQARFVGATGCKSSSCHGGAGEKHGQYFTWAQRDFHTRGFAILTTARSARIAEALGLKDATSSSRCTVCHSPFQALAPQRLAAAVDPRESVSCENCHGAPGPWLRGHTRTDWTYATRIGAGMRDLKSFYVRANTCVACHQNLDTDLSAAGHPDLLFEMDRQSVAEPKHWTDPEGSGPRAWLVGQAVALREASWKLARQPTGNEQTLAQYHGLAWLLAKISALDSSMARIDPPSNGNAADFAHTQQQADALARHATRQNLDPAFVRRLLSSLAGTAEEFSPSSATPREVLFPRAQRLVLALAALDADKRNFGQHTDKLLRDVRSLAEFDPVEFGAHLATLRDAPSVGDG
ncbi:MAG: multiheme c-type cytochrome [Chthoniobacterales bacterium]